MLTAPMLCGSITLMQALTHSQMLIPSPPFTVATLPLPGILPPSMPSTILSPPIPNFVLPAVSIMPTMLSCPSSSLALSSPLHNSTTV
uniref:Uncharacterized protein n=1 Tax=Arundo donax TaxID=35708 RepID=A0A0A9AKH0_ARUDO